MFACSLSKTYEGLFFPAGRGTGNWRVSRSVIHRCTCTPCVCVDHTLCVAVCVCVACSYHLPAPQLRSCPHTPFSVQLKITGDRNFDCCLIQFSPSPSPPLFLPLPLPRSISLSQYRRIDVYVTPYAEFPCMLLHFTGSGHFNRSIRSKADKLVRFHQTLFVPLSLILISVLMCSVVACIPEYQLPEDIAKCWPSGNEITITQVIIFKFRGCPYQSTL